MFYYFSSRRRQSVLEPIVAPEQLASGQKRRRAEDTELLGILGLLAQALLVLRRLGAGQHGVGVEALAPQDVGKHALVAGVRLADAKSVFAHPLGVVPSVPDELWVSASERYMQIYEMLTGKAFLPGAYPIQERLLENLRQGGLIE